ncbi:MAG TPA: hypothetical protein PK432_00280 [Candidatus Dojkabacteria bacterium]|nr:hypothetical protein [Candidatus Dojkabacteria bacterium]HPP18396.1 hypothetical protein [Candidatus Dojkabacteria bacterium]
MSVTIVSLADSAKSGSISIKPFFDPNKPNLGLEKYGLALFDGVFHEEQLACIEKNGIKRYITGLNEFAPEIKLIPDPEVREAKIKEIRTIVAQLERELATNVLDPKDPDFWNRVTLLQPNNDDFWSKISIRCGNNSVHLDPAKDPYDLIKLYAIDAGGFSIVCKSFEEARSRAVPPKFYLDRFVDTVSTKTEVSKIRNKALSELIKMFDKNQNKLFYVCKVVDGNSVQYKKSTPNDVMYDNMDKFITGQGVETNLRRAAQTFLDACNLDMETLKIKSIVKDASFYKFINPKSDGFIYHTDSNAMMGRNVADCIEYLKNPLNDSILLDLTKKVEKYWNV